MHVKLLLKRFHLNGHTAGFRSQTQKLELQTKLGVPSGKCQRGEFVYLLWNVPIEIFAICYIILEV